ncbi:hypothetical protein [Salinarimonas soli]|uniref:TnsA endonuclease N-terminal domain-containing protein n=1 Tax=Salinarimonas soli TaxID=1638099 RepID=A0A5B2VCK2_9HYPH|nr:hypothetical protein [Salinarimonas soli]KAA2235867.1 hypothetical protein F0L46_17655 [Salinarimonas soli]
MSGHANRSGASRAGVARTPTLLSRHVGKPQPTRRVVTGRRDCITGEYPSGKAQMGYRMVAYEGLLARDYIVLIEDDPCVVSYQEEPAPFRWFDGAEWRLHRPDFAVRYDDGSKVCAQVKPARRVASLGGIGAFGLLAAAAKANGYDRFELWTELTMDAVRLANAALVASERTFLVDEVELHTMRVTVDRFGGDARIVDLRLASGLGDRSFRAVLALVARGELAPVDPFRLLDDHALVRVPA